MRHLLAVMVAGLTGASALAGPQIVPIKGIAGHIRYDMATGQQTPVGEFERFLGPALWSSTQRSGYFWAGQECQEIALDWGDIISPITVGGFAFSYATNADPGFTTVIGFYDNDNGWNNIGAPPHPGRSLIVAFEITGCAGTHTPTARQWFWSWIYRVAPVTSFVINSVDFDQDQWDPAATPPYMGDWSYTYWFDQSLMGPTGNEVVGPIIAGDPNAGTAPGIENAFDLYNDPDYQPMPGYIDPNLTYYVGTYWFGGSPYAQFYMELFAPACPNRGEFGHYCHADIAYPYDCVVGLADLAQLLGCYGCDEAAPNSPCYPDCTRLNGDISPYGPWFCGNGVINLSDLAELLGQYGDNCNWPQP